MFNLIFFCFPHQDSKQFYLGLPHHATLGPATTYYTSAVDSDGPNSPSKYHENGHDTFSDFVTLVCQEAQSTSGDYHSNLLRFGNFSPIWQLFRHLGTQNFALAIRYSEKFLSYF